jgi:lipopolysaccharide biosynthesis glycosyltransferase
MKICYLISKDYYELTCTSIAFVKQFYKGDSPIEFFIFHFGDLDSINNSNLTFVKIERKIQQFFLNRPFIFEHFNEKIIFLDSDTVCQTNIKKLYDTDLGDSTLGVVECSRLRTHAGAFEVYPPTLQLKSIVIRDEWPFFNAGVMLVDCKKWNQNKYTQKFLDIFNLYESARYSYSDEVAFNLLLGRDHCKFLDVRWNYNNHEVNTANRPYIVHYYGDPKKLNV